MKKDILIKGKIRGLPIEFKLSELYAYEGEVCGVLVIGSGEIIVNNSGYEINGLNDEFEVESCELIEEVTQC